MPYAQSNLAHQNLINKFNLNYSSNYLNNNDFKRSNIRLKTVQNEQQISNNKYSTNIRNHKKKFSFIVNQKHRTKRKRDLNNNLNNLNKNELKNFKYYNYENQYDDNLLNSQVFNLHNNQLYRDKKSNYIDDDRSSILNNKKRISLINKRRNQSLLTNLFYRYTALMQSHLLPALLMFNNNSQLWPTQNVTNLSNDQIELSYNSSNNNYFSKFYKPQVSLLLSNNHSLDTKFNLFNSNYNDILSSSFNNLTIYNEQLSTINTFNSSSNLLPSNETLNMSLLLTILITVILVLCILVTAIGNLFVIAAILSDRVLRNVQNYLVLSLAFADLMVAILVMPLSALYELKGQWTLGVLLCDVWTWADVLLCTASILHLLAIAMDRFWAVTSVEYMRSRSSGRVLGLIAFVWFVALLVSVGPILGWKDDGFEKRVNEEGVCSYSQDLSYQLFATIATFYAPLIFILLLYWRIFQVARKRLRNKPGNNQLLKSSSKATSSIKQSNQIQQEAASIPNEDSTSSCSRTNSKYCKSITNDPTEINESTESNELISKQQSNQDTNNNNPLMQSITDLTNSSIVNSPATTIIELQSSTNTPMHHLIDQNIKVNGCQNGNLIPLQKNCTSSTELLPMKQISTNKALSVVVSDKENKTTTTLILSEESSTQFNVDEQLVVQSNDENTNSDDHSKKSSFKKSKSNKEINQSNMSKEMAARLKQKQQQDSKRERKTARILAIITGVFVICWLPFFVLTLLKSLIPKYREYTLLFSIFLWLGYINSSLNPAIYTIFSPDFRSAFKKLLTRSRN